MALGSNRDYARTHRITMKRMRRRFPVTLWTCDSCGRKQYPTEGKCPRCGTPKGAGNGKSE